MRKKTPLPGRPVRGSSSGRPIMALFDLLGRRSALRIVWELSHENFTFRALETAAQTNPSVLSARLRELREAGVVDHDDERGYALTREGIALVEALGPTFAWAARWARRRERARAIEEV